MLAEAERRDGDSDGYLFFKDRETEIKSPFLSSRKYPNKYFLPILNRKIIKPNLVWTIGPGHSLFFIIMKLL